MRLPFSWLKEILPGLKVSAMELAEALTMAGAEVESIKPVADSFTHVVVGKIKLTTLHPHAQKLKICEVDVGQANPLSIVCGAPNAEAGMLVPCALPGALLSTGKITVREIRGVRSSGMLCSRAELGVASDSEENGLWRLDDNFVVGMDLRQALDLDDVLLEIKLTPNRGDCLSILGIAREVAAIYGLPLPSPPKTSDLLTEGKAWPIAVEAFEACPRYCGQVIRDIDATAPTPHWMKMRLERSGQRSINVVVDITNYVMLELGQPLHAFDVERLVGAIHIRFGRNGERLTLLNGQEITAQAGLLFICDDEKPVAAAGVMGGMDSGVSRKTQDIFIESAFFTPDTVQGWAKKLGVNSEAAHRFERGVDFELPMLALGRATQLILQFCGGKPAPIIEVKSQAHLPARPFHLFSTDKVQRILGVGIPPQQQAELLRRLQIKVEEKKDALRLSAPSFRFDLKIDEDWVEEIARLYGYDKMPVNPPSGVLKIAPLSNDGVMQTRRVMVERDYQEVISYSFVSRELEKDFGQEMQPITLANPMAVTMEIMRTNLLGSLVLQLANNVRFQRPRVRLFEVGRCFSRQDKATESMNVSGVSQPLRLAAASYGLHMNPQWGVAPREEDYFDGRADVEALFFPRQVEFTSCVHPAFHPARCAFIKVKGKSVGILGQLHPALMQKYYLAHAPILFELALSALERKEVVHYVEPARTPEVTRDLAFVMPSDVAAGRALAALQTVAPQLVRHIEIFDLYANNAELGEGKKSLAFRITMQDPEQTLEEKTITAVLLQMENIAQDFGAKLREGS